MPFIGLGLHLVIALFFAVHALRTGRNMYWLIILFSFPLLGSVVYFIVEFLPELRIERAARKAGNQVLKLVDPGREVRAARDAFDLSPTAQNEMRLAHGLLETGELQKADQHFRNCLAGPFGDDPDLRMGAARSSLMLGNLPEAARLLQAVRKDSPGYRAEDVLILLAQTHWGMGENVTARARFQDAVAASGGYDAQAELLMFELQQDNVPAARQIQRDLDINAKQWTRHARKLHAPMQARVREAWAKSGHSPK